MIVAKCDDRHNSIEIDFFNNKCTDYFACHSTQSLHQTMEYFLIPRNSQLPVNLLEMIKQFSLQNPKQGLKSASSLYFQNCYLDLHKPLDEDFEASDSNYDVRIFECPWKGRKAVMAIINDVSQEMKLQRIKETNEFKDKMLSSIAHNLKTPLNCMTLLLGNIQKVGEIQTLKDNCQVIKNNCYLLQYYIQDILDYSQTIMKDLKINIQQFDLGALVNDIAQLFQPQFKQKDI